MAETNEVEGIKNFKQFSSKKGAKALFTLSYIVSYELKKLLQIPSVRSIIDSSHLEKFQFYFKQSLGNLVQDEISSSSPTQL